MQWQGLLSFFSDDPGGVFSNYKTALGKAPGGWLLPTAPAPQPLLATKEQTDPFPTSCGPGLVPGGDVGRGQVTGRGEQVSEPCAC